MKDALVNIEHKYISIVDEDGSITNIPDGYEVISISDTAAAEFEADPNVLLYLVDGEVKSQTEMDEIISTERSVERKESQFQSNAEFFKSRKIQEIKLARDDAYNSNIVTSDGLHFKADLETIIDVQQIIAMLADGDVYPGYKNANGAYNDITKEQFITALTEGALRKSASFATEKVLTEQVDTALTFDELNAITW